MEFYNRKDGRILYANFRKFQPEDAPEIVKCIREAYSNFYVKPYLYDEKNIANLNRKGELIFTVCETDSGEFVGMLGMEVSKKFPGQCEYVTQVNHDKFRGFGIAHAHISHNLSLPENNQFTSLYGYALTCHVLSQKSLHQCGFRECGFHFSVFDSQKFKVSSWPVESSKISQAILIRPGTKKDAGTLFISPECLVAVERIYKNLGVHYRIQSDFFRSFEGANDIQITDDTSHRVRTLKVQKCGADFEEAVAYCLKEVMQIPNQTVNVYLDVSRPEAAQGYPILRNMGFCFSGMQALCSGAEFMVLHHPLKLGSPFDGLQASEHFREIINDIKSLNGWR